MVSLEIEGLVLGIIENQNLCATLRESYFESNRFHIRELPQNSCNWL